MQSGLKVVGDEASYSFIEGAMSKTILMKKGEFVVGKVHKKPHFNFMATGRCILWLNGEIVEATAPYFFKSEAGERKVAFILEDVYWTNVVVTDKTTSEEVEEEQVFEFDMEMFMQELKGYDKIPVNELSDEETICLM